MGGWRIGVMLGLALVSAGCQADRTGDRRDGGSADAAGRDASGFADAGCAPVDERCDGVDDDCDGRVDEGLTRACGRTMGLCAEGTETCVDGAFGACEGATGPTDEACDGALDEDCDGSVDEGCECTDGETRPCGEDAGRCTPGTQRCVGGAFDTCDGVAPRDEVCDGIDDDCDERVDEGVLSALFVDADGDGHGDPDAPMAGCPSDEGLSALDDDCDDGDEDRHPGVAEACDGVDQDCDGSIDETDASAPEDICPCAWAERMGHAYLFCRGAFDWAAGRARCLALGYDYVRIDDAAEDAFVFAEAEATGPPQDWWIGLNDRGAEGTFVWADGTALGAGYAGWNTDQPDDGGAAGSSEDCVELNHPAGGAWNDLSCDVGYPSIVCEAAP
ncbi:MAG TPA: C-type lectin domain-containing protein [Sandaracinaceae bacterium LLY-WYZ-13_1]|nr:C-type lectin domain-containing protein [Sandaracinaceae bacterium LLY-WYZ-13_1]